MDAEQTTAEIERLERIFAAPDIRPLSPSDLSAANRRHDEMLAHTPWFPALAAVCLLSSHGPSHSRELES
jgi:hypothetical protein